MSKITEEHPNDPSETAPEETRTEEAITDSVDAKTSEPDAEEASKRALREVTMMVVWVSIVLNLLTAVFKLDFLLATLIGSGVVGLNYFWTARLIPRLFTPGTAKAKALGFYMIKFGISAAALIFSITWFQLPALGVLIGVSNLPLAVGVISVKKTLGTFKN